MRFLATRVRDAGLNEDIIKYVSPFLPLHSLRSASEIALREMKTALKAVIDLHQATWETLEGADDCEHGDASVGTSDPADRSSGGTSKAAQALGTEDSNINTGCYGGQPEAAAGARPVRLQRGLSRRHLAVDTDASGSAMQRCERAQSEFDKAVRSVEEHMAVSDNETFLGKHCELKGCQTVISHSVQRVFRLLPTLMSHDSSVMTWHASSAPARLRD